MADEWMALLEALRKGADLGEGTSAGGAGGMGGDFLRETVRWLLGELMDLEVSAQIGAERYERSGERVVRWCSVRTRRSRNACGPAGRALRHLPGASGVLFPVPLAESSPSRPRRRLGVGFWLSSARLLFAYGVVLSTVLDRGLADRPAIAVTRVSCATTMRLLVVNGAVARVRWGRRRR